MPDPDAGHEIRVPVALGPRSYSIRVGTGDPDGFGPFARQALDSTWAGRPCRSALVATDRNLAGLPYLPLCLAALERVGIAPRPAVLPAGEATKSLEAAARLYDELIAMRADRHTVVVALGGGVIGDLAGFVGGDLRPRPAAAHGPDHAAGPGRQLGRRQGRRQPSRAPRT